MSLAGRYQIQFKLATQPEPMIVPPQFYNHATILGVGLMLDVIEQTLPTVEWIEVLRPSIVPGQGRVLLPFDLKDLIYGSRYEILSIDRTQGLDPGSLIGRSWDQYYEVLRAMANETGTFYQDPTLRYLVLIKTPGSYELFQTNSLNIVEGFNMAADWFNLDWRQLVPIVYDRRTDQVIA